MNIDYRVSKSGKVTCHRGRTRLSEPFGELAIPVIKRRLLALDRTRVRAAWAAFGRRGVPNDLNSVAFYEKQLRQVDADQPRLLGVAYHFMVHGYLTPSAGKTLVQRLKAMFTRTGASAEEVRAWKQTKAYQDGSRAVGRYDPHNFWNYSRPEVEALTEAGWRYLVRLPYATLRAWCSQPWRVQNTFQVLNLLATLQVPPVTTFEFSMLESLAFILKSEQSRRQFVLAFRGAKLAGHAFTAEEEDFLNDRFRDNDLLDIRPGRTWGNLVADAQEFMAQAAMLQQAELQGYHWAVPLAPFELSTGISVRILADGAELLEEGIELKNCLRKMTHYAARATKGECLVAALRGAHSGTAEVVLGSCGAWEVSQVAKPGNVKVYAGLIWDAAQELAVRLNNCVRTV